MDFITTKIRIMNIEDKRYERIVELLKVCQSVIWKNVLFVNGQHYELVQEIEQELNKLKKK